MTTPLALVASSSARAGPSKAGKRNRGSRRVAARGTAAPSKPKKKTVESSKQTPKRDAREHAVITDEDSYPAFLVEYLEMACRPSPEPTSRREALSRAAAACSLGAVSSMMSFPAPPAAAIYNKDLDIPITDPTQAMATVFAARAAVQDVLAQIADFEETCPAPVFPCDLSQLSVKASTRVSGPLKRALPTLSEAYGADPYAVQDIIQSVSTCEAMLYANNARVKVDFKGPATFFNLVDDSIEALLRECPEEAVAAGRARFDACDLSVAPEAEGDIECRLARAISSGARPKGGMG
jgi:hypothetical protein